MLVRTLREHDNSFPLASGEEKYSKTKGDLYDHPGPDQLIDDGIVEKAPDSAKPKSAPTSSAKD